MKKILLAIAMLAFVTAAQAQFVVSAQLGGSKIQGTTTYNAQFTGLSPETLADTSYFIDMDPTSMQNAPLSLTGGVKFGYQFGKLQVGITGSFSFSHFKNDLSGLEYYNLHSEYPYVIISPNKDVEDYIGWYKQYQMSYSVAPYARYEVIQFGDVAFFLELSGFFKQSLKPTREDFIDFYWMEMHHTLDSTFRVDDECMSFGAAITPGLSWQLTPHCYVDLYFDLMSLAYRHSTRTVIEVIDKWDVLTDPYILSRRQTNTITTTESFLGFGLNGSSSLTDNTRNLVRVGINYTF